MFSPPTLATALRSFDAATPKFVVIQACFSGGFIGTAEGPSALHGVEHLTLLTATAHDRPSFGCGAGKDKTYYGGSYNRVLAQYLDNGRSPTDLPWSAMYADIRMIIDAIESIDAERASQPGFLQTGAPPRQLAENADTGPARSDHLAHLGRRCGGATQVGVAHVCGRGGRIAAIVAPVDVVDWPEPAGAELLVERSGARGGQSTSRRVLLEGDRLWIRDVTCGSCARVIGLAAVVELRALTPAAVEELRGLLGIDAHVPLRTPADWRAFFSATGR
jgi:hypothetical protein